MFSIAEDANFDRGLIAYQNQDYSKAFSLWKRSARSNNPAAMYNIALLYEQGKGVTQDDSKSQKWYQRAAENGYILAYYQLGKSYSQLGEHRDAYEWFVKAAETGDVRAQHELSVIYLKGVGVKKNIVKSFEWMLSAAQGGDVEAQYFTALMYIEGFGTSKQLDKARKWLTSASQAGHEKATEKLQTMAIPQ